MGVGTPHRGAPTAATVTQTPVANTTAGQYAYTPAAKHVIVSNLTTKTLWILINTVGIPTISNHHVALATDNYLDVSFDGAVNIESLSIWFPTGSTLANLEVNGWPPTT